MITEKDPLLVELDASASNDELREFVRLLQERYKKHAAEKEKRVRKLREQRKDIERKNKAIGRLKAELREYQNMLEKGFLKRLQYVFCKST